jgi:nitronate monooxygenase
MRAAALAAGDLGRMQAWAGQSARLARAEPAGRLTSRLWDEAQRLLGARD